MLATFMKMSAGSAFAAVLAVPQLASAGHGCGCPCPPRAYAPAGDGVHHPPAGIEMHHAPAAPGTPAVAAPAPSAQPPIAQAPGQVIRRFSYEPGTESAGQGVSAVPVYGPARAYRPAAPGYRSSRPVTNGQSAGGLTGEARLHPGRGRNR